MSKLIKCAECAGRISKHAESCVHCGSPIFFKDTATAGLETYQNLSSPIGYIIFYWVFWLIILLFVANFFDASFSLNPLNNLDKSIFILYASAFTGLWTSYFLSKCSIFKGEECRFIRYKTLRRLLGECSMQWRVNKETDSLEESFRRKSGTSIDVIAILIAVAILELDQVTSVIREGKPYYVMGQDAWKDLMLFLGAASATTAFIAFSLSIDALDVIFNKFKTKKDRHNIIHYFYLYTINPKYIGLICIISGVIFISAFYNYYFASMIIGIVIVLGYGLWFPNVKINNNCDPEHKNINKSGRACAARVDEIILFLGKAFMPICILVAPVLFWLSN